LLEFFKQLKWKNGMQLKSVASTQTCLEVLQALGRRGIEWRDAPGRD